MSVVMVIVNHNLGRVSLEGSAHPHARIGRLHIVHWHCGQAVAESRTGTRSMAVSNAVDKS